jgi:hypothetical protein
MQEIGEGSFCVQNGIFSWYKVCRFYLRWFFSHIVYAVAGSRGGDGNGIVYIAII